MFSVSTTSAPSSRRRLRLRARIVFPVLLFLAGSAATLHLWLIVQHNKHERTRLETRITAEHVALRLQAWVDSRTAIFQYLSNARYRNHQAVLDHFSDDARLFQDLYPGIQALNYIDPQWIIRIVAPLQTNMPALDKDLHQHPSPSVVDALKRAEETGELTRTPIIDLLQGGKGFATYKVLRAADGTRLGFVNGVFRVRTLVDTCLAEQNLRKRFSFQFHEQDGRLAYEHVPSASDLDSLLKATLPVRIVDRPWILTLAPAAASLEARETTADDALAGAGLLLFAGLAFLLHALLRRKEQLEESRTKYRLLVENQSDLVVKVDPQGRFLYVSPSYCRTFGKSEEELLGQEFMPLIHEKDRERTRRAMQNLHRPPHKVYLVLRALTKDGWRWLAWLDTAILNENGAVEAIIGVGRDISHQKELEEQLFQSQKLQAIGQFAGGIAHDFNNILQAMLAHLEFVKRESAISPSTREDLEELEKDIERARELTKQLLAFGRRQKLDRIELDLNEIIQNTTAMLRRLMPDSIYLDFQPGEGDMWVYADRGKLEQVLVNLCVNARDATGQNGTITIRTFRRHVDEAECENHPDIGPGDYVCMSVRDDGCGMDAETREHIFEPFFTTKPDQGGTGLGLATAYGIVHQHGGFIEVESEPDLGSTFTVCLPAAHGGLSDRPASPADRHS